MIKQRKSGDSFKLILQQFFSSCDQGNTYIYCIWSKPELPALSIEQKHIHVQCQDYSWVVFVRKFKEDLQLHTGQFVVPFTILTAFQRDVTAIHISTVWIAIWKTHRQTNVWGKPPTFFQWAFDLGDLCLLWSAAGLHNIRNPAFFKI